LSHLVVIALFILSHVLSEFYFQTDTVANEKGDKLNLLIWHGVIWIITAFFMTLIYYSNTLLLIIFLLGCFHLLIDKYRAEFDKIYPNLQLESFLIDQILHLSCIVLSYPWLKGIVLNHWFITNLIEQDPLGHFYWLELSRTLESQWVIIISLVSVYLFNFKGANYFVVFLTKKYFPVNNKFPSSSQIIGQLERIIIVTFVLLDAFVAIGMVFAAKSIARFKELEDDENPDFRICFLVGTLASTLIAILTSLIAKIVITSLIGQIIYLK